MVNGVKRASTPIRPGKKKENPEPWFQVQSDYREHAVEDLKLNRGDLIEVYVEAGSKMIVVDDFEMTKVPDRL